MVLTGANFIGFRGSAAGDKTFQAFSTVRNDYLPEKFVIATENEFQSAIALASQAFTEYSVLSYFQRAGFLEAIAKEIMALGDSLIERCALESGLPVARITGERKRTCDQLQLFALLLREGWWMDARIDKAQPERQPLRKPDVRRMFIPLGPVAVFGASNFPLAFSTAGGDTVSALAAGCPVVVKAHSSHPGTNALVASAIVKAAQQTGMPEGVFSSLYLSHEFGVKLVRHPGIKAVGFTGSRSVGMTLFNAVVSRPDPIPVYAEMSSVNPVILLEGAMLAKREETAKGLAAAVTMGAGQFCTNPGLVIVRESEASKMFLDEFARQIEDSLPATMLNRAIYQAYRTGVKDLRGANGIALLATACEGKEEYYQAQPAAHAVNGADFISNKELSAEIFGPSTLVVICKDEKEMREVLHSLEGQLTATIHAAAEDETEARSVAGIVIQKAGRIIYGGYPTGVEVCHSMQHGGPFPSTTDSRCTSVGTAAIHRFLRPVAFQDFPDHLLPEALRRTNPLHISRLVDGEWTKDPG